MVLTSSGVDEERPPNVVQPPSNTVSPFAVFFTARLRKRAETASSSDSPPDHVSTPSLPSFLSSVDNGAPYLKHDLLTRTKGNLVISPPHGLYPAIALIPTLGVLPQFDSLASHAVGFGPMFLASVGSVIAQITVVYYINMIGEEKEGPHEDTHGDCVPGSTSSPLRLVCLVVFVMVQLSEIKSALEFLDYVFCVPSVPSSHVPILREKNVKLLAVKTLVKNDKGEEFRVEGFAAGGFTQLGRIWALFWVLVDVVVNAVVLMYGSIFVLFSGTNEELILNAVALNFISKIDDTAYDFLITRMVKGWIDELPEVGLVVGGTNKHRVERRRLVAQVIGQVRSIFTWGQWCCGGGA